jgi:hypothetical protein
LQPPAAAVDDDEALRAAVAAAGAAAAAVKDYVTLNAALATAARPVAVLAAVPCGAGGSGHAVADNATCSCY